MYTYNPAKARALLAAAGYANGLTFKVVAYGEPGSFDDVRCAAIARDFAAVGVTMQCDAVPGDKWGVHLGNSSTYEGWIVGITITLTWVWYGYFMKPGGGVGLSDQHGWHDPVSDKLWLKGIRLPGRKAQAIWRQLMTRTITQAYYLPITWPSYHTYVSKRVRGIRPVSAWGLGFNSFLDWAPTGR
jgi:ABC-type transport system substrate-binding protein